MTIRTKPLTEGGSLFNKAGGSIRPSTEEYAVGMNNFFLMKELKEYVGRFKWTGLPLGLNQNILETMVYYKGQLCFFKVAEQYYILPFVYTGQINHYGIQTSLIPISFNGTVEDDINKTTNFAGQKHAYVYEKGGMTDYPIEDIAVVFKSGSGIFLNRVLPTIVATDQIRNKLIENLILVRYNLILSQPMKYINVANEAAAKSIQQQADTLIRDILNGNVVNTIVGNLVFEDVNTSPPKLGPQELWQSFASLDSLRMEYLGILNNGVFEKRERNLTDEVAGKQTVSKLILGDDLWNREMFCTLINQVFGLSVKVELNPDILPPSPDGKKDDREGKGAGGENDD